uniref:Cytochrome P450 CYP79E1 n=1 Tax=Triglochin maritima TaxID=55501 RepID=Q9M7C0_9LILI|nr:cytochrome P450 CYP79E1 [Triglochin maritima]
MELITILPSVLPNIHSTATVLFLLLLTTALSFLFLFKQHLTKLTKSKSKSTTLPPGPRPWPIVGSLVSMYMNRPSFRWILAQMEGRRIGCIRLGGVHVVPVNCPEIAREFLKVHDADFASRPVTVVTRYSSRGFRSIAVVPLGEQWKKMRRVVASEIINAKRLQWQLGLRTEEADNIMRYITYQCNTSGDTNGAIIDVRFALRHYCANVIRRMLFGKRYFGSGGEGGGPGKEEIEHVDATFDVLGLIYAFNAADYVSWLKFLDLHGQEKKVKKAIDVVNKYHDSVIESRRERKVEGREDKDPEDLLDVLLSLKDSNGKPLLDVEEIKAQIADLTYATVDNPSNAVEWALAEMLNNPDILQKATDEVDQVVGRHRLVQESDFPNLPYIRACAREALRLHPVAAFNLPHVSLRDTHVAGFFIPKGSHVLLSRVGLGRNPKVWDNPLRFDPDRHLHGGPTAKVELAEPELRFVSFTTGRRGCMGGPLGTAMTYMLLARFVQGFTWGLRPAVEKVELEEEKCSMFLGKPLRALAKPRQELLQSF